MEGKYRLQNGFTLLEVLVATVILFSSIVAISMAYRGALISSNSASRHLELSNALPFALEKVGSEIQRNNTNEDALAGSGVAFDVDYRWQASLVKYESAPEQYDASSGQFVTSAPRFKLWKVNLTISKSGVSQQYDFHEVSWDE